MEPNIVGTGQSQGSDTSLTAFSDERYLLAYGLPAKQDPGFRLWDWKKILLASSLGVGLGLGGAAFQLTSISHAPKIVKSQPEIRAKSLPAVALPAPASTEKSSSAMAKAPEPVPVLSQEEATRLKARNRRLEALISVLRQRAHAPDRRPVQEQATYLGQ